MPEIKPEKLKDILGRKFQLLKDYRFTKQYYHAAIDYHYFISTTEALRPIMKRLMDEERIAPIYLEQIFNDVALHGSITQTDVKNKPIKFTLPNFYDQEVEKKYKLLQKHFDLIKADYEDFLNNPAGVIKFDLNVPVIKAEREDEFFYSQKLFNDIIDSLDIEVEQNNVVQQKAPYWQDDYLYLVYKILKSNERMMKTALSLNDLQSENWTAQFTFFNLGSIFEHLKIKPKGVKFHTDIYKKYCPQEYVAAMELIEKYPEKHQAKVLKKLFDNDFQIEEFGHIDFFVLVKFGGVYEFIEFDTKLDKNSLEKLDGYLKEYLELFINNQLSDEQQNFLSYTRMKDIMLQGLWYPNHKYGNSFLFRGNDLRSVPLTNSHEFLFLHTMVALEYQKYLHIENLWVFNMDVPPEKQTDDYKIKLELLPKFTERLQIIPNKEVAAPTTKKRLSFDPETAIFSVDGKPVKFTKFSQQYHCLRIIFEHPDELAKDWFFSEIAEKIDSLGKLNDKTIYNAFSQIKIKIGLQAKVDDLFQTTAQSVKINKKYL